MSQQARGFNCTCNDPAEPFHSYHYTSCPEYIKLHQESPRSVQPPVQVQQQPGGDSGRQRPHLQRGGKKGSSFGMTTISRPPNDPRRGSEPSGTLSKSHPLDDEVYTGFYPTVLRREEADAAKYLESGLFARSSSGPTRQEQFSPSNSYNAQIDNIDRSQISRNKTHKSQALADPEYVRKKSRQLSEHLTVHNHSTYETHDEKLRTHLQSQTDEAAQMGEMSSEPQSLCGDADSTTVDPAESCYDY